MSSKQTIDIYTTEFEKRDAPGGGEVEGGFRTVVQFPNGYCDPERLFTYQVVSDYVVIMRHNVSRITNGRDSITSFPVEVFPGKQEKDLECARKYCESLSAKTRKEFKQERIERNLGDIVKVEKNVRKDNSRSLF